MYCYWKKNSSPHSFSHFTTARHPPIQLHRHPELCLGTVSVFVLVLIIGLAVWPGVLEKKKWVKKGK